MVSDITSPSSIPQWQEQQHSGIRLLSARPWTSQGSTPGGALCPRFDQSNTVRRWNNKYSRLGLAFSGVEKDVLEWIRTDQDMEERLKQMLAESNCEFVLF